MTNQQIQEILLKKELSEVYTKLILTVLELPEEFHSCDLTALEADYMRSAIQLAIRVKQLTGRLNLDHIIGDMEAALKRYDAQQVKKPVQGAPHYDFDGLVRVVPESTMFH